MPICSFPSLPSCDPLLAKCRATVVGSRARGAHHGFVSSTPLLLLAHSQGKSEGTPEEPYAGLVTEKEYWKQLEAHVKSAGPAPWLNQSRPMQGIPFSSVPHGSAGPGVPRSGPRPSARLHQRAVYRDAPDIRPLLAALVTLPEDRTKPPVPLYSEAEIQAAAPDGASREGGKPLALEQQQHQTQTRAHSCAAGDGRAEAKEPNLETEAAAAQNTMGEDDAAVSQAGGNAVENADRVGSGSGIKVDDDEEMEGSVPEPHASGAKPHAEGAEVPNLIAIQETDQR